MPSLYIPFLAEMSDGSTFGMIVVGAVIGAVVGAIIAGNTGRDAGVGCLLGLLLGPLGWILVATVVKTTTEKERDTLLVQELLRLRDHSAGTGPSNNRPAPPRPHVPEPLLLRIKRGDEPLGAWSRDEIASYIASGNLVATDQYWHPDKFEWRSLDRL